MSTSEGRTGVARCVCHLTVSVFVIIVSGSCASSNKFQMKRVETLPIVESVPVAIEHLAHSHVLAGIDLTFPGHVLEAEYDRGTRAMLVRYATEPDSKRSYLVHYDLANERATWAAMGNASITIFGNGITVLESGPSEKIYDASTGTLMRDAEPSLYIIDKERVLTLAPDQFSRINLRTGEKVWEREGSTWKGFRWQVRRDDWIYVVAEGLHAFNVDTGEGWFRPISTSHAAVGKSIAKDVGKTVLAAFLGRGYYGTSHADLTHNVSSLPLPVGQSVFFAARENLFCFDRLTGEVRWETVIGEESGIMNLHWLPSGRVGLTSLGWKWVDFTRKEALPPSITVFEPVTGEMTAHLALERGNVLLDLKATDDNVFLLTPDQLFRLDNSLNPLGVLDVTPQYGEFVRILNSEDPLVMRTTRGALAVSQDATQVLWFKDLGRIGSSRDVETSGLDSALNQYNLDVQRSWNDERLYWIGSDNKVTAINLTAGGETVFEIPIYSGDFRITGDGDLIAVHDNHVRLFSLDKQPL